MPAAWSEAFATLLELIEVASRKASEVLFDRSIEPGPERGLKILDAYQPVFNQARIVRLYLPKPLRAEFCDLVNKYCALHSDPELGDRRITTMDQTLDRIQELFEEELSPHFWLRAPLRWWRVVRRSDRASARLGGRNRRSKRDVGHAIAACASVCLGQRAVSVGILAFDRYAPTASSVRRGSRARERCRRDLPAGAAGSGRAAC